MLKIIDVVRLNLDETVYAEQASKLNKPLAYIVEKTSRRKKKKLFDAN